MEQNNNTKTTSTVNESTNKTETSANKTETSANKTETSANITETSANKTTRNKETDNYKFTNKINMDYDWNSEYGDGDIPDIDK